MEDIGGGAESRGTSGWVTPRAPSPDGAVTTWHDEKEPVALIRLPDVSTFLPRPVKAQKPPLLGRDPEVTENALQRTQTTGAKACRSLTGSF